MRGLGPPGTYRLVAKGEHNAMVVATSALPAPAAENSAAELDCLKMLEIKAQT
jgi:hypothetical protein